MPDLGSLNFVDYLVLALLVISGIMATFRGMTREMMGIAGWGVSILGARFLQPLMVDLYGDLIGNEATAEILAFSLPFILIVIVWYFFANVISPGLRNITFGTMDKFLGFMFGVARGLVFVTAAYIAGLLLLGGEHRFPDDTQTSASIVPARIIGSKLIGFAPEDIRETVEDRIPDQDLGTITDKTKDAASDAAGAANDAAGDLLPDEQLVVPE